MKLRFWKRKEPEAEKFQNLRYAMTQTAMQIELSKGENGELALKEYVR